MKFIKPFFPVFICISLMISIAIFIAITFIFLAMQAFYEIHSNSGAMVAYLVVIAGVMMVSIIAYQIIVAGFCHLTNRKKNLAKSGMDVFAPIAKVLLSVLIYEGLKMYLDKQEKKGK